MSVTHATPETRIASSAGSWREIPHLTGQLLWRHWPALLFWFLAQRVSYDLLLKLSVRLAEHSVLLGWAALALLIVTQLAGTIAMFLALRPSLPMLAAGNAPVAGVPQPWVNALAVALLPFFAYYATWGLLEGMKRDFRVSYIFGVWHEQQEPLNDVLAIHGLWLALLVSWAVRHFSKRRAASSGRLAWSVLATTCEAYWVFVGVAAIGQAIGWAKTWWHERVVYVAISEWWENPFAFYQLLPSIKRVLVPTWDFLTTAAGGIVLPLVWLAITAIVYGLDLRRTQRIDAADPHLRMVRRRYRNAPLVLRKLADKASAGWTSKGVPVLNSLRLVLRAGLPALLTLCVCWQLLAFLDAWAWRAAIILIGPQDPLHASLAQAPVIMLFSDPQGFRPALFPELIRIALLAATFDRAIAHLPRLRAAGA
ncbi:MAG TPA: hypothetical protein VGD42_13805 [Lysobacter sp.]